MYDSVKRLEPTTSGSAARAGPQASSHSTRNDRRRRQDVVMGGGDRGEGRAIVRRAGPGAARAYAAASLAACARSTSPRTASVSSAFSATKAGEVFTA